MRKFSCSKKWIIWLDTVKDRKMLSKGQMVSSTYTLLEHIFYSVSDSGYHMVYLSYYWYCKFNSYTVLLEQWLHQSCFSIEFIAVGKPTRALDTLQEVFRNKKWAYNWSESVLEPIILRYLELCVDLRKSHIAKEGLFQYRNLFQSVNVGSLENVIRGYLRMAEERTENAREQSAQAIIDIDDLDNLATPESILLRYCFC